MSLTKIDDRGLKTPIDLQDNEKIRLGTGNDYEIYHDGSNAVHRVTGDGDLKLLVEGKNFIVQGTGGHQILKGIDDGAVELYHNNSKHLETDALGVNILGRLDVSGTGANDHLNVDTNTGRLRLGGFADLQLFHDTSNINYIQSHNNVDLHIRSTFDDSSQKVQAKFIHDGAVELYHNNSMKLTTTSSGARINGNVVINDGNQLQLQNSVANRSSEIVNTGSSTNSTLSFKTNGSERMLVNESGNVLVGATSYGGGGTSPDLYISSTGGRQVKIHNTNSSTSSLQLTNAATGQGDDNGLQIAMLSDQTAYINQVESAPIRIDVNGSERMRIDSSGNILFGTTSAGNTHAYFESNSASRMILNIGSSSTAITNIVIFRNPNNDVGRIQTSGSTTIYSTSSDYRLKENAVAISDGITRLKTLKPYRFNFKADKSTTLDGFFAHEVTAVPEAVSGIKDEVVTQAMIDIGDYKQSELANPIHQGIDHSKLVPLLTAALQEAVAKIEVLETKVATLEAA